MLVDSAARHPTKAHEQKTCLKIEMRELCVSGQLLRQSFRGNDAAKPSAKY
jgi:hypothetical protein